jgi:hypothetical protein
MAQLTTVLIALTIATIFVGPALFRPTLGRLLLSAMFLGGALFNFLYTLPSVPGSVQALVTTAPVPPYRQVVDAVVALNIAPALVVATTLFEATVGALMLWRGRLARLSLLAAGVWGLAMLPVIPPDAVLIGIVLTGAPGVAGLLLARRTYPRSTWEIGADVVGALEPRSVFRDFIGPIPALLIFAGLSALFVLVLHPWFVNWGSTQEEQAMALPGDTAPPSTYFTRAITINAPVSAVWPWLLAIGQDRAGFLSNDYLENLTGADIHNADTLRPEWQQRAVGDRVPMASPGERALGGDATSTTIHILEPERAIADTPGRFLLVPQADGRTRLLLRESLDDPLRAGVVWVLWDPMHFVMEQRMLQGIKERAEGQALVPPVLQVAARVGWVGAGIALFGLFLTRSGGRRWLALPVGVMAFPLWFTGDLNSFLAGFLAIGITLVGFLAFGWRWLPSYLLIASGVALVLLLASDSYTVFGLLFLTLTATATGAFRGRLGAVLHHGVQRSAGPVQLATSERL